ncbi:hypothetical protein ACEPAF_5459 [Sanghuangporus sanghuang]
MSQPGPSRLKPDHSEPGDYSLEVLRVDNIQNNPKKSNAYVEVKINKTTHEPVIIGEGGKPTSNAILPLCVLLMQFLFTIC